jgi:hypothetical protein
MAYPPQIQDRGVALAKRHGALLKMAAKAQKETIGAGTHPAVAAGAKAGQDLTTLPRLPKKKSKKYPVVSDNDEDDNYTQQV